MIISYFNRLGMNSVHPFTSNMLNCSAKDNELFKVVRTFLYKLFVLVPLLCSLHSSAQTTLWDESVNGLLPSNYSSSTQTLGTISAAGTYLVKGSLNTSSQSTSGARFAVPVASGYQITGATYTVTGSGSNPVSDFGISQPGSFDNPGNGSGSIGGSYPIVGSGTLTVWLFANFSTGTSWTITITATVYTPPNTAPTFVSTSPQALSLCTNSSATDIKSLIHVNDADASQTETWTITSNPTHGTLNGFPATASSGSSNITPGGTLTYTPTASYSGTDAFTVHVSDGSSSANMVVNVTTGSSTTNTEAFESATAGGTTFTSYGQGFTITSQSNGPFIIQNNTPGAGWSGTAADNQYIDNDGTKTASTACGFTVSTSNSASFQLKSMYLYLGNPSYTLQGSGTVTIVGKLSGSTVFTASGSSGWNTNGSLHNGFTLFDMTSFGGANNSTASIDQFVITTASSINYVALDALTWGAPCSVSNTTPVFVNTSPQTLTVCENASATDIKSLLHVNDADANQTETWSQSVAPNHGGTLSFSSATASSGLANITPGGTITYTPANGYSGSESFTVQVSDGTATTNMVVNVTVNPSGTVNAVSNQTLCNNVAQPAISFTGTQSPTFTWANNTTSIGLAASGSGNIGSFTATNGTAAAVTATISVTPTSSLGCVGTAGTFTIQVRPSATVTGLSNQTVCNNIAQGAISFSGTQSPTFTWANNTTSIGLAATGSGNIASFTATNGTASAVTATISVTPTSSLGCVGTAGTFTIQVNPSATINAVSNQTVCNNVAQSAISFSGSQSPTFTWANNTTSIGLAATGSGNIASFTATNGTASAVTATISVTPTSSLGCVGTAGTFTIQVNPSATINAISNQTLCNNVAQSAISFSGSQSPTFTWTNNTTSIGLAATGSGNIASFTASNVTASAVTATINVTPTSSLGCAGTAGTFTIQVNPPATVTGLTNQNVCSNSVQPSIIFTGSQSPTFTWTNNTTSIGLAATGSGNIASFTATNGTASAVTATISVTPTSSLGCVGTAGTFTIQVNPPATINAISNQTVCNNVAQSAISFSGTQSPTFTWTNNTTSIGLGATGSGNIASFTATNGTASAVTATINVTPTSSLGCAGASTSFTIQVNPSATINAIGNQTVCNNAAQSAISFSGTQSPTFTWTNNTASIGLAATGAGNIASFTATNGTGSAVTATINVTPTSSLGCAGTAGTFTILVNPSGTVTGLSNQSVCHNATQPAISFSGTQSPTFTWTNNTTSIGLAASGTGSIGTFTATNAGSSPVVASVSVTPTSSLGCVGTVGSFTITVNPIPTVNSVSNQSMCAGTATTAVAFSGAVSGTTYNWTNTNTSIGLAASGSGNIASFVSINPNNSSAIATVTVTPTANGCAGTSTSYTYNINNLVPSVAISLGTSPNICAGTTVTFTAFPTNGGPSPSYQWYRSGSPVGTNSNTYTTSTSNTGDVISCVMTSNATCAGPAVVGSNSATMTVNPVPVVNAVSNQTVCNTANTSAVAFAGGVTGTVYNWTNNNTSIGLAANGAGNIAAFTATNASAVPVTATITVTPSFTNGATTCTGTPQTFTITVNPTPSVATISNQTTCNTASTNAVSFSGSVSGTTFSWTNSASSIGLAASGSGSIAAFTAANTGNVPLIANITVTPTANNCSGAPGSYSYTVNPTPNVNSMPAQVTCNTATALAVTPSGTVGGTVYNWANSNTNIGLGASGTGTVPSYTATNTGTTQINGVITVTPTYTNNSVTCTGATQSYTAVVNPTPNVASVSNQTVCNGASTAAVIYSGNVSGTVFNWSNTNTSIGLAASGTGNVASFTATNSGTSAISGTVTVTPVVTLSGLACTGANTTYTYTINPTPTVSAISNQTLCHNTASTAVSFTGAVSGTAFSWVNTASSIGLAASGTGNIASFTAVNTSGAPVVASITVTPTANSCTGATQSFSITVQPIVQITSAPVNQAICNGAASNAVVFTGTPSNIAYAWTNTNTAIGAASSGTGNIASFTASNSGSSPIIGSFTITPSANGCTGNTQAFTMTVNPTPTVNSVSNQTLCNNAATAAISFSGSLVSGTVYNWTNNTTSIGLAASGSGNISSFNATNTTAVAVTANLSVTPAANGCNGLAQNFAITVNPTPTVNGVSNQSMCAGVVTSPVSFSGAVSGTAYSWTNNKSSIGLAASGTGNIGSFTTVNPLSSSVVATITVTPTANGCTGNTTTYTYTVNNIIPVVYVSLGGASSTVCAGTSRTINAIPVNGGSAPTYQWFKNSVQIPGATGSSYTSSGWNTGDLVYVGMTSNAACATPLTVGSNSVTISVNPIPVVNAVSNQSLCNGANSNAINFSGGVAGTVYSWTNDNSSIGLGSGGSGNIASFTAVNSGTSPVVANLTVTPTYTNNGVSCTGTPQLFTITVNPTPSVNPIANQAACNGSPLSTVSFSGPVTGTTFAWSNNTTSIGLGAAGNGNTPGFTAVNTGTSPVSATVTVTPTANACIGSPLSFGITVNPTPVASAVTNQTLCNNALTNAISFSSSVSGTTYSWTNNTSAIGLSSSGTGSIAAFTALNGGSSPLVAGITVVPSANTCTGTGVYFTITVNPGPIMAGVSNQVVCNGATTTATNFSSNVFATNYSWTNSNTSIGLAANGTGNLSAFTATNTGTSATTATITVSPADNNCSGTSQTFTITVNPSPSAAAPANQSLCNGTVSSAISLSGSVVSGTTYNWSTLGTSIGIAGSGAGTIGSFTAVNTTNNPVVATVYISPTANGCSGQGQFFTMTVNPTPSMNAVSNQSVCNNATTSAVNFSGPVSGTTYSWTNSAGTIGLAASGTGNISAFTAANSSNSPLTATISVTPTANTCAGTATNFNITVNPTPVATVPGNQTLCGGSVSPILTLSSNVAGSTYSWTNNTTSIGLSASGTGNIPSFTAANSSTTAATAIIGVTPSAAGCLGSPQTFTITVNPGAALSGTTIAPTICSGATASYNALSTISGASLNWTRAAQAGISPSGSSGSGNISEVLSNSNTIPVVVTYVYSLSYNGCTTTANVTDTVKPVPALSSTLTPSAICNNTSFIYPASSTLSNTSYSWSRSAIAGLSNLASTGTGNINELLSDTSSVSVNVPYVYTLASGGCTGTSTVVVTVYKQPSVSIQPTPSSVCAGGNTIFTVTAGGTSVNYQWQVDTGAGYYNIINNTTYSGTNTATLVLANVPQSMNGYQYKCVISNICTGTVSTSAAALAVKSLPAVTSQPQAATVCEGSNTSFSAAGSGAGITYQWQENTGSGYANISNGGIYGGATSTTLTLTGATTSMNGNLYRCVVSGSCAPVAITNGVNLTVNANPVPVVNNSGPLAFCTYDSVKLSTTSGVNYSYQWQMNSANLSAATDSAYEVHSAGSYKVTVVNNYGCTNTSLATVVTTKTPPSAPMTVLAGSTIFCDGDSATLGTNTASGLSYQWQNNGVDIAGAINASYTVHSLGFYTVAVTDSGCTTVSNIQTIITNQIPSDSLVITGKPIICSGSGYKLSTISVPGQYYQWYNNGALIAGAVSATYTAATSGSYNVEVTNASGCNVFTNSIYLTYVISPTPVIYVAGDTLSTDPYANYQWYLNGAAISGANSQSYGASLNGAYTVSVSDTNGCSGTSVAYQMTGLGVVKTQISGADVRIYPNPATSVVHFDAPVKVNVSISSLEGKLVLHGNDVKIMDISKLANGVYMIQVYDENNALIKTDRLLKNNW